MWVLTYCAIEIIHKCLVYLPYCLGSGNISAIFLFLFFNLFREMFPCLLSVSADQNTFYLDTYLTMAVVLFYWLMRYYIAQARCFLGWPGHQAVNYTSAVTPSPNSIISDSCAFIDDFYRQK